MPSRSLQSYAHTGVSAGQSRDSIERLLARIGADVFRWTTMGNAEGIEFRWPRKEREPLGFRFVIRFETPKERAQMLRVLYWYLKSKIEAIEFGLVDVEQEFLPQMVTEGGRTVFEAVQSEGMDRLVGPDLIALPASAGNEENG